MSLALKGCIRPSRACRSLATAASAAPTTSSSAPALRPYPFAPRAVVFSDVDPIPPPNLAHPQNNLLSKLNNRLVLLGSAHTPNFLPLFSRRYDGKLWPGAVLTVESYTIAPGPTRPNPSFTTFTGMLIAVYRKGDGMGNSFVLRNVIERTGVEIRFSLASPLIKSIDVIHNPTREDARAIKSGQANSMIRFRFERKSKLYYVRTQTDRLVNIPGLVRQRRRMTDGDEKAAATAKADQIIASSGKSPKAKAPPPAKKGKKGKKSKK